MDDKQKGIEAYERLVHGDDHTQMRGACKKCGGMGHLTYECKNNIKVPVIQTSEKVDPFAEVKDKLRQEIAQLRVKRDMLKKKVQKTRPRSRSPE